MSYLIGGILGIAAVIKKNNKLLFALLFAYAFIVFAFNVSNPDLLNYSMNYTGKYRILEPIYNALVVLFNNAGVSFWVFRGFIAFIGLVLVSDIIIRYSPYPNLVFFLYLLYPFVIDIVQFRSFISLAIMIFSVRFIIDYHLTEHKLNIIFFLTCLILATGIHYAAVFYSILLLLFLDVRKNKFLFYFIIPVCVVVATVFVPRLAGILFELLGEGKTATWISAHADISLFMIFRITLMRVSPFLLIVIAEHTKKSDHYLLDKNLNKRVDIDNENINFYLILSSYYMVLYSVMELAIATDYERLSRFSLVICTIALSRVVYKLEKHNKHIYTGLFIIYYIIFFFTNMYANWTGRFLYIEGVFRRVMENNLIFGVQ